MTGRGSARNVYAAVVLAVTACGGSTDEAGILPSQRRVAGRVSEGSVATIGTEFVIQPGGRVAVEGSGLRIEYLKSIVDGGDCEEAEDCDRQSGASVQFLVQGSAGETATVTLNTHRKPSGAGVMGHWIQLVGVADPDGEHGDEEQSPVSGPVIVVVSSVE